MAAKNATDLQVQNYVDQKVRSRCNDILDLHSKMTQDQAQIDDVYAALTQPTPTWSDSRTDGPPHLATPGDVLAWNTFVSQTLAFWNGTLDPANIGAAAAQLSVLRKISTR